MKENYINSAVKQFEYYKALGTHIISQLSETELHWHYNTESNSVAVIINHLSGNMKSRWTDFLTTDGEKEWRNRDVEFEPVSSSKAALLHKWEDGWACLFKALQLVNNANFNSAIFIRNQRHTIPEAINRQMMHYAYHVGQMVFLGKMMKGKSWQSLSIEKGKSKEFNDTKFSKGKHKGHFTDEIKRQP